MHWRITEHIRQMMCVIDGNPELKKIIELDPKAESNGLLRKHLENYFFLVGLDVLKINMAAEKIPDGEKYDPAKIRRRVEEHLRKYVSEKDLINLALFYGVSLK